MCIAIYAPDGISTITESAIVASFKANDDGAGFAWAHNGKLKTSKGYWTVIDLLNALDRIPPGAPMLLHCRISTAGKVDNRNCHPFDLKRDPEGRRAVVIHNGILPYNSCDQWSDTAHFTTDILAPSHQCGELFEDPLTLLEIEEFIGRNNKIAMLRSDGEALILNEDCGHWHNGVWYSNYSYETWDSVYPASDAFNGRF